MTKFVLMLATAPMSSAIQLKGNGNFSEMEMSSFLQYNTQTGKNRYDTDGLWRSYVACPGCQPVGGECSVNVCGLARQTNIGTVGWERCCYDPGSDSHVKTTIWYNGGQYNYDQNPCRNSGSKLSSSMIGSGCMRSLMIVFTTHCLSYCFGYLRYCPHPLRHRSGLEPG